jgi:hypothetical protein
MTWATPTLAIIAAAIAIPSLVILYFLKLRRRSVEISTTLLWRKAIQDLQANAPFQKLRRNLLLLLQLLVLAAALLAIAQPERTVEQTSSSRHVIMIDRSASMAATDGSGDARDPSLTRLDAAKQAAIDVIDSLDEGDLLGGDAHEAMVIAFDTTAEVVERFTPDKARLRRAVESVAQTDIPGSIQEAFQLAQAHRPRASAREDNPADDASGETPEPTVLVGPAQTFHLFTDGRIPDLEAFLPGQGDSVIYHTTGAPGVANAAITGLRAERAYDTPEDLTIFVGVQNSGPLEITAEVELALDGVPSAIREVTIPPAASAGATEGDRDRDAAAPIAARAEPGRSGVVFDLVLPDGALAAVRVRTPDDALATDDVGHLVIPPASQTSVAVVTSGNLFLANALEGLPLADLATLTPAQFQQMVDSGTADRFDVVLLDGMLPPGTPAGRALAPGRWLVLGAVPGSPEGLIDNGEAGFTQFIDWKRDHPLLRGLTLDPVRIGTARAIEVPETSAARTLAETPAGPGIVEFVTAESRAVAVLFDIAESNWPFDVSFVVFLASAIDYLDGTTDAGVEGAGDERSIRPGEILTDRLPIGAQDAAVEAPGGARSALAPAPDGRVSWGPVRRVGVHELSWSGEAGPLDRTEGGRPTRLVASNLLDPFESDITPAASVALASEIVSAASQRESGVERYWRWLLLVALAIIILEWYIYNRKVYV